MLSNLINAQLALKSSPGKVTGDIPTTIALNRHKITIGRQPASTPNDVMLSVLAGKSNIISRRHAEITYTLDGQFIIRDLGSLNGVFVNDRKIEMHVLCEKDIVQFGGHHNATLGAVLKGSNLCVRYEFSRRRIVSRKLVQSASRRAVPEKEAPSCKTPNSVATGEVLKSKPNIASSNELNSELHSSELLSTENSEGKNKCVSDIKSGSSATHIAAMTSSLSCAICSLLLLDAVVCPCSHGFCRACIETYHRSRGLNRHVCPICNIKPVPAKKPPLKSHSIALPRAPDSDDEFQDEHAGEVLKIESTAAAAVKESRRTDACAKQVACYFRSSHLDAAVGIAVEANGPDAIQKFHEREIADRKTLVSYNIDPDAQICFNIDMLRQTSSSRHQKASGPKINPPAVLCSYCGEQGHTDNSCPHDDGRSRKRKKGYLSPALRSPHFSDSESTGECSAVSDSDEAA